MKIVFHPRMRESYDNTPAGAPGRLNTAIEAFHDNPDYHLILPDYAPEEDLLRAHDRCVLERVKEEDASSNTKRVYEMAALAAGGAILTAEIAAMGEPVFGLIRPPGHHASARSYWGFCYFNNMAVALLHLRSKLVIKSAFILDFDLHVGDGTIDILGREQDFHIYNPHAHGDSNYLADVKSALDSCPSVDMIAASAGFDEYEHCWGQNLSTGAFRKIGRLMYDFAQSQCDGRRFGLLEGGYNHHDLGKNVLAFCEGLQGK